MADRGLRFKGVIEWDRWRLDLTGRTLVMGIVNVTPDSFSDGGQYLDPARAIERGLQLADEGADIIDVGGQSTRPGSEPIGARSELDRVLPVISALAKQLSVPISIDSTESQVAQAALDAGAAIVNDISALRFDEKMAHVVAQRKVPVILMHMLGTPATMQTQPQYDEVIGEIRAFLRERIDFAERNGIDHNLTIIDVGIGFGKRLEDNLALLRLIDTFFELGRPVMVGHSRKRFLGDLFGLNVEQRDQATLTISTYLASKGVHILRVHEPGATRKAVDLIHRLQ